MLTVTISVTLRNVSIILDTQLSEWHYSSNQFEKLSNNEWQILPKSQWMLIVALVTILGTTIMVLCLKVMSVRYIWRSSTHLQVLILQLYCLDKNERRQDSVAMAASWHPLLLLMCIGLIVFRRHSSVQIRFPLDPLVQRWTCHVLQAQNLWVASVVSTRLIRKWTSHVLQTQDLCVVCVVMPGC